MENAVMSYRLDQYLTLAGEGSRSQVKQFLKKGLVQVDGITEKQAKRKVLGNEQITLNGKPVYYEEHCYLMLHKPAGVVTATEDKKEKAYLINYFLEQFRTTLYRQTMFAHFEQEMHQKVEQGETLTADVLCDAYYALNQKYYGEAMVSDDLIRYEWARIPHFYTPFYVYQYATGFSAAIAISSKILAKEEGIVEKYKAFLSGGCSMDPIDLLKLCGVDMEKKEPVEEALKVFEQYLTELEKLV